MLRVLKSTENVDFNTKGFISVLQNLNLNIYSVRLMGGSKLCLIMEY